MNPTHAHHYRIGDRDWTCIEKAVFADKEHTELCGTSHSSDDRPAWYTPKALEKLAPCSWLHKFQSKEFEVIHNKVRYRGVTISNLRRELMAPEHSFYIGRPSVLGNPYFAMRDGTRLQVVDKFYHYARESWNKKPRFKAELIKLARHLVEYGELDLACFCAPQPCHGYVIANIVHDLIAKGYHKPRRVSHGTV